MPRIRNEDRIMKIPALLHLSRLGYEVIPRREEKNRDRETNLMTDTLREALAEINGRAMSAEETEELMRCLRGTLEREDLGFGFYRILRDGWRGWRLVDWEHPERNRFQAAAEMTCARGQSRFTPDITLMVNGIPLAMIEVKTRQADRGIRAEYDRMRDRFRNGDFRRFLQEVQIWVFSNDRENDPDRLLPTEGAFYATGARGDFPIYAFSEKGSGREGIPAPLRREEERKVLAGLGAEELLRDPAWRACLSPRTPTHRMLTGLFSRERLLFLLRYGVHFETDGAGGVAEKRLLTCEQLRRLREMREKEHRGYRNRTVGPIGAAGEGAFRAALIALLRETGEERRIYWMEEEPETRERIRKELSGLGLRVTGLSSPDAGDAALSEIPADPEAWLSSKAERNFRGRRVVLTCAAGAGRGPRALRSIRKADPEAVLILVETREEKPGGNYVYLLECADGSLYCGWTNDLQKRVRTHNAGQGARYTRARRPVRLAYYEETGTRQEAMRLEWRWKQLTRAQKEELVRQGGGVLRTGKTPGAAVSSARGPEGGDGTESEREEKPE